MMDRAVACNDCREVSYLGHGCASTWLFHMKTLDEFDKQPENLRSLQKNKRYRKFLERHAGHNVTGWSSDSSSGEACGVVVCDYTGGVIADVRGFENVDLEVENG